MRLALDEAHEAFSAGEVPVGAVLVDTAQRTVIASARNAVESSQDATAHAEIQCMRRGAQERGNWRLSGLSLYTTLEPCPMCAAAIRAFRVDRIVYGASSERLGAIDGSMRSQHAHPFHEALEARGGVLADECAALLLSFFRKRREGGGQQEG